MSENSLWAISLSPRYETTWRWLCSPPFLALVMTFSAMGRRALAFASVVTMPSAATSDATRFAIMRRWCWELPPTRRPFLGDGGRAERTGVVEGRGVAVRVAMGGRV